MHQRCGHGHLGAKFWGTRRVDLGIPRGLWREFGHLGLWVWGSGAAARGCRGCGTSMLPPWRPQCAAGRGRMVRLRCRGPAGRGAGSGWAGAFPICSHNSRRAEWGFPKNSHRCEAGWIWRLMRLLAIRRLPVNYLDSIESERKWQATSRPFPPRHGLETRFPPR